MSRHKIVSKVFLILMSALICGAIPINDVTFKTTDNQCKILCETKVKYREVCERGCRLFAIIDAKGQNLNKTKDDCYASCFEAYDNPYFGTCTVGCDKMLQKKEYQKRVGFIVYIDQEGQNNVLILNQIDLDTLGDPDLKKQLDYGYPFSYKIPETHIRTMPISDEGGSFGIPPDMTQYQPSGDWLDCASRNSGIPRWMLLAAILLAVLLGIWLIFTSEKREPILENNPKEIETLVSNSDINHLKVVPPPKYSLKSEKV